MYNNPKSMNILVILRDTIIFYVLLTLLTTGEDLLYACKPAVQSIFLK